MVWRDRCCGHTNSMNARAEVQGHLKRAVADGGSPKHGRRGDVVSEFPNFGICAVIGSGGESFYWVSVVRPIVDRLKG